MRLSTHLHDRDAAGLTYVYPVVSRRAGGVSVGVNLNPNKACNWRCVYCQVPGLVFGNAPEVDLALLERELRGMLDALVRGDYMQRHVPEGARHLEDVALSGDGEPTSSAQLDAAVEVIGRVLADFGLAGALPLVLITNGSLVHKPAVQDALRRMASLGGKVWYKLDSPTREGMESINTSRAGPERAIANLRTCAALCPTWIQTCAFSRSGRESLGPGERAAYAALLAELVRDGVPLEGVLLYGLARPSHQPEAPELDALPAAWFADLRGRIEALGLPVRVHP